MVGPKLQLNLDLGRRVVDEVKSLGLESSTLHTLRGSKTDQEIKEINDAIDKNRELFIDYIDESIKETNTLLAEDSIDYLKSQSIKDKVGNCAEQSLFVARKLREKGAKKVATLLLSLSDQLKNENFNDVFNRFKIFGNHVIVVLGLKRTANLHKPETWGKNAVIVDSWLDIAEPAISGLNKIFDASGIPKEHRKDIEIKDFAPELFDGFKENTYSWDWYKQDKSRG